MENLRIRRYEPKDFESALNLDGRSSKRRAQKLRMLELTDVFYGYVAETDQGIEGFVIMEDMGDGKSRYMVQINVRERRKGIGRRLVMEALLELGIGGHMSLCVNTDNEGAIKFYEAMGFKRSGYTQGYKKGQNKFWYQIDV